MRPGKLCELCELCDDAAMILADAIEAWGQAHRDRLEQSNLEKLGAVWNTVRRAEVGSRPVADMTKDDARSVMLLFEEEARGDIADLLNTIRTWTLDHAGTPTEEHDGTSDDAEHAGSGAQTLDPPLALVTSGSEPLAPPIDAISIPEPSIPELGFSPPHLTLAETQAVPLVNEPPLNEPLVNEPLVHEPLVNDPLEALAAAPSAQATGPMVPAAPAAQSRLTAPQVIPQGPAPALPPPLGYTEDKPEPPYKWIGIGLLAAIVLVAVYLIFSGGDGETPDSTETGAAATETAEVATTEAAVGANGAAIVNETAGVAPATTDPVAQFCSEAQLFDQNAAISFAQRGQGAAFYTSLIDGWSALSALAPANIANDFATVQAEYVAQRDIAAAAGYDMESATLLAELDARDRTALTAAQANISNVMLATCQVDVGGFLGA